MAQLDWVRRGRDWSCGALPGVRVLELGAGVFYLATPDGRGLGLRLGSDAFDSLEVAQHVAEAVHGPPSLAAHEAPAGTADERPGAQPSQAKPRFSASTCSLSVQKS